MLHERATVLRYTYIACRLLDYTRRWRLLYSRVWSHILLYWLVQLATLSVNRDIFPPMTKQPLVGEGLPIIEASRLHADTPQSAGSHADTPQSAGSHADTPQSAGSSGRVISLTQRNLPDNTQLSNETDIDAHGRIRTLSPSNLAVTDPRLRPRSHWDRQLEIYSVRY